jgi:phosphatidylserine synthase
MIKGIGRKIRHTTNRYFFLLPGIVTFAKILSGFVSVFLILHNHFFPAALVILISSFFNFFYQNMVTRTIWQVDILADCALFCFAPGFLLYAWALYPLKMVGFGAALFYVCCALRKSIRFNAAGLTPYGLPICVAAFFCACLVMCCHSLQSTFFYPLFKPMHLALVITGIAFLMICHVRFPLVKKGKTALIVVLFAAFIGALICWRAHTGHLLLWYSVLSYIGGGFIWAHMQEMRDIFSALVKIKRYLK